MKVKKLISHIISGILISLIPLFLSGDFTLDTANLEPHLSVDYALRVFCWIIAIMIVLKGVVNYFESDMD